MIYLCYLISYKILFEIGNRIDGGVMVNKKVAVLGVLWWSSIFVEGASIAHNTHLVKYTKPAKHFSVNFASCDIHYAANTVHFLAIDGPYIDETTAYKELFHEVDLVVYIVSELLPKDPHISISDDAAHQRAEFSLRKRDAEREKALWPEVPWIWVVTRTMRGSYRALKTDFIYENPLHDSIPSDHTILPCGMNVISDIKDTSQAIINKVLERDM
jgi:hypothetical protein